MSATPPRYRPRQILIKNASGEDIPARSVAKISGHDSGIATVIKPDADNINPAQLVITGFAVLPSGEMGVATPADAGQTWVEAAETPVAGDQLGTTSGEWTLERYHIGFICGAVNSTIAEVSPANDSLGLYSNPFDVSYSGAHQSAARTSDHDWDVTDPPLDGSDPYEGTKRTICNGILLDSASGQLTAFLEDWLFDNRGNLITCSNERSANIGNFDTPYFDVSVAAGYKECGTAFNVTITAKTSAGATDTGYSPASDVSLAVTGGDVCGSISPTDAGGSGWSAGAKTVSVTLPCECCGTDVAITATDDTDGRTGGSTAFTIFDSAYSSVSMTFSPSCSITHTASGKSHTFSGPYTITPDADPNYAWDGSPSYTNDVQVADLGDGYKAVVGMRWFNGDNKWSLVTAISDNTNQTSWDTNAGVAYWDGQGDPCDPTVVSDAGPYTTQAVTLSCGTTVVTTS